MEPATAPQADMAPELTPEEEQATKEFLEEINKWTVQYNVSPLSWNVAVKFLMARKFDVLRAIELFHSYRETRRKEGIVNLKPHEEPLRSEILSGKFTILDVRDPTGASIALFTARLHHPHKSVQHVVLQALFYLLDRAVDSFETQRNGLVFIYDMCGSNYTNFELDLGKKVLNLLKGAFPARLKKVLIVGAPIWFRVPYSIISLLLKDKVRERVSRKPREEPLWGCTLPGPNKSKTDKTKWPHSDYINASFMDGYKQKNAYIGTQGPLENTYRDFWLMVWEQKVLVIVMTTRFEEGGRRKCGQYWPLEKDSRIRFGFLTVTNLGVENMNHYKKTTLEIHNTEERQKRQVTHFQFLSWPDYGVPSSAASLIDFLRAVRSQQRLAVSSMGTHSKGQGPEPPIVVHCSAGIGRTGTFCSLDICLAQLEELGTLNVFQTVSRMRTQRAFSIQTPEQYYFCYKAILEFAEREGMVPSSHNILAMESQ
ncbi:tyrosine-protein phosphatase non-receptor type 9 isoform X3 [Myotis myotis]|uniref:tyrosine-protein phosphatase non-receptor type 9 isoform X3 n=1 Tax=Myotis myotis TaxID=51298 RepID=UPI00174AF13D|nr:tyrosine-protein phosphatase non-receptor type 9 isoform X3 [Myotis myotis]